MVQISLRTKRWSVDSKLDVAQLVADPHFANYSTRQNQPFAIHNYTFNKFLTNK